MGSSVELNQATESVGLSVLSLVSFAVIITEVVPIAYSPSSTQQDLTDRGRKKAAFTAVCQWVAVQCARFLNL